MDNTLPTLAVSFSFIQPLQNAFQVLVSYIPQLIGALIILVVGYVVAKVIQKIIAALLAKFGFNSLMDRAGVGGFISRMGTDRTAASLLGLVVFWFVFVIFLTMFAEALGVPAISGFLNDMVGYIPRIFAAIAILFLAALLANFLASLVRGATGSDPLASVARYVVVVYAAFVALTELGIAASLIGPTVLVLLGGIALAGGIAFGWGGRGIAENVLRRATERQEGPGRGDEGGGGSSGAGA